MEYITANGIEYECQIVTTSINGISFTVNGDVSEIATAFKEVVELTVSGEDKEVYGEYSNLYFSSATVDSAGTITIFMSIKSSMEQRVDDLEFMVTEFIFGGEE